MTQIALLLRALAVVSGVGIGELSRAAVWTLAVGAYVVVVDLRVGIS